MSDRPTVALIGECMIELSELHRGGLSRGYGGDVLNTSVYLSRLMGADATVRFTTLLGEDPFSSEMVAAWEREGINCDTVGRLKGRNAGLYFVRTDKTGERTFHYWRSQSAAREIMGGDWADMRARAMGSDWIYLSGITLAILDDTGREKLLSELAVARESGAHIAFDGNFRPNLWTDPADAAPWHAQVWDLCALALAGVEDEAAVFGDATPGSSLDRLRGHGIAEIVIKRGPQSVLLDTDAANQSIDVTPVGNVIDTTAAGDSFNAGYMAARLKGRSPAEATHIGAALAAEVIQHPGAVISPAHMPTLL